LKARETTMRGPGFGAVLAAAAVALLAAAGAPGGGAAALAGRAQPDGAAIFAGKGNCATCHGVDGTGTRMAPDLTDGEWLHGDGSYETIAEIVRKGVAAPKESPTPMPAMGGAALTDGEVAAVARYVHALSH
jgi:cbb3-type cytochrome c oxidase subunit III